MLNPRGDDSPSPNYCPDAAKSLVRPEGSAFSSISQHLRLTDVQVAGDKVGKQH